MLYFYCKTLARVMESRESSSDSRHSDHGSHTLEALDDGQMGLVFEQAGHMPHTCAESPQVGQGTWNHCA
jgi:hypothetical protein